MIESKAKNPVSQAKFKDLTYSQAISLKKGPRSYFAYLLDLNNRYIDIYVDNETAAEQLGVDVSTIKRWKRELQRDGILRSFVIGGRSSLVVLNPIFENDETRMRLAPFYAACKKKTIRCKIKIQENIKKTCLGVALLASSRKNEPPFLNKEYIYILPGNAASESSLLSDSSFLKSVSYSSSTAVRAKRVGEGDAPTTSKHFPRSVYGLQADNFDEQHTLPSSLSLRRTCIKKDSNEESPPSHQATPTGYAQASNATARQRNSHKGEECMSSMISEAIKQIPAKLNLPAQIELAPYPDEAIVYVTQKLKFAKNIRKPLPWFVSLCDAYCADNGITPNWRLKFQLKELLNSSEQPVFILTHESDNYFVATPGKPTNVSDNGYCVNDLQIENQPKNSSKTGQFSNGTKVSYGKNSPTLNFGGINSPQNKANIVDDGRPLSIRHRECLDRMKTQEYVAVCDCYYIRKQRIASGQYSLPLKGEKVDIPQEFFDALSRMGAAMTMTYGHGEAESEDGLSSTTSKKRDILSRIEEESVLHNSYPPPADDMVEETIEYDIPDISTRDIFGV